MTYALTTILLGAFTLAFGGLFVWNNADRISRVRPLPRARLAGFLLGLLCLVWSAYEGCLMLEGPLARFHVLVWLLVPVTAVLCWFFLDYLLARALGGILVFTVNFVLHEAFVYDTPCRWLYAANALFWGILGLFLLGTPWRWRQLLEYTVNNRRLAIGLGVFGLVSALIFWFLPLLGTIIR